LVGFNAIPNGPEMKIFPHRVYIYNIGQRFLSISISNLCPVILVHYPYYSLWPHMMRGAQSLLELLPLCRPKV
jgi:hypothetical protein